MKKQYAIILKFGYESLDGFFGEQVYGDGIGRKGIENKNTKFGIGFLLQVGAGIPELDMIFSLAFPKVGEEFFVGCNAGNHGVDFKKLDFLT